MTLQPGSLYEAVTATRASTPLSQVPATVTLVDPDTLTRELTITDNLTDVLAKTVEDADRTNDTLRKALKLPDDYEDVIGFPEPLAEMVSDSLNSKRPDDSSEQEDE